MGASFLLVMAGRRRGAGRRRTRSPFGSSRAARPTGRPRRRSPERRRGWRPPAGRRRRSSTALMIGSPSVTTPASGAIVAVAITLTVAVLMPPKIERQRERELDAPHHLQAGQAHAAGGVDGLRVDLADADVGVGQDRRDRQQHERERDVARSRRRGRRRRTRSARGSGTARPTFETLTARNSPLPRVAEPQARSGSGDRARRSPSRRRVTRGARQQQVSSLRARRPAAPPARLASALKMKSIGVAELAEDGEQVVIDAALARVHGVARRWTEQDDRVERRRPAGRQAAGDDDVRLEGACRPRRSARRGRPRRRRTRASRGRRSSSTAIRSPAMISGSASGSSTRQSSWLSVRPMPAAGVVGVLRHVVEAGEDVAEDDQQRVRGQRDRSPSAMPRPVIGSSRKKAARLGIV